MRYGRQYYLRHALLAVDWGGADLGLFISSLLPHDAGRNQGAIQVRDTEGLDEPDYSDPVAITIFIVNVITSLIDELEANGVRVTDGLIDRMDDAARRSASDPDQSECNRAATSLMEMFCMTLRDGLANGQR